MRARIYQVDAFTSRRFAGNPAAVCPLEAWPGDDLLQSVAAENNLSETAFLVPDGEAYGLRWFTPEAEVALCGHATLAAAFVLLRITEVTRGSVRFRTASGELEVVRDGELFTMDFPARPPEPVEAVPPELAAGLGAAPASVLAADDWLAVFDTRAEVAALEPDMGILRGLDRRGVIATAPADGSGGSASGKAEGGHASVARAAATGSPEGGEAAEEADSFGAADFVSRFFAPGVGVPEDPVTGSTHCTLAPYWSGRLGRDVTVGRQISRRGGEVRCDVKGDRVALSGRAVLYLEGWIRL